MTVIWLLSLPSVQALGWTLVHFLWQGALLAACTAVVMRWGVLSSRARYVTGVATLVLMMAVPVFTFAGLQAVAPAGSPTEAVARTVMSTIASDAAAGASAAPVAAASASTRLLTAAVMLWFSGVLVLSARLLGGWAIARRLATTTKRPVAADVEALAVSVAERLGLRRLVRVAECSSVAVPIVIGWLKPVVLVPSAAVAGLSPAHLEALLAHELAHVRRHDYLVNLLQSAIETLLFYHPAVWWVSGRVRQEREHCCDDAAVAVCDKVIYVNALAGLAAMRSHTPLALAATDGALLRRVRRLLISRADERPAAAWLSASILVMIAMPLAPAGFALSGGRAPNAAAPSAVVAAAPMTPATVPAAPQREESTAPDATPDAEPAANALLADVTPHLRRVPRIRETTLLPDTAAAQSAPQRRVYTIGGQIKEPHLLTRVSPLYPQEAKAAGVQGPVYVEAIIGRDGRVRDARPVGGHPSAALREAATAGVRQWVYTPTLLNGEPIEVQLSVQVNFRLTPATLLVSAQQQLMEARAKHAADDPEVFRLEARVRELEAQVSGQQRPALRVDDPMARVRLGDLLTVTLAGEDQIPHWYVIESDGTIRLPLIGRVTVIDRMASQIHADIAALLAKHNLGQGRIRSVVIHRPQ